MAETTTHDGTDWTLIRLPSALEASRGAGVNRIRPWRSSREEQILQRERVERIRRENGIPSPDDWMW
ncbi:MAG: hypothetical protein RLZZ219_1256 [Cyanobacteriota bacterium]